MHFISIFYLFYLFIAIFITTLDVVVTVCYCADTSHRDSCAFKKSDKYK